MKNGLGQVCRKKCIAGCNEIQYTISVEKYILDDNKICNRKANNRKYELNLFDTTLENYIMSSANMQEAGIRRYQALLYLNQTQPAKDPRKNKEKFDTEYCKRKIRDDIAMVDVVINTPTIIRYVQNKRVSLADRLANFGKLALCGIL